MKYQKKTKATATNGNLTPSNRVLGIPELLEQITRYLDFDSLENRTNFGLVCRLWSSMLERYIWRSVTLRDNGRKSLQILKRHGNFIHHLRCHRVDKTVLQSIARHAPNLETIHLTFDRHSLWATPDHLAVIFHRLSNRLVTVSLVFDEYFVDLRLLEKLELLKSITKLVLAVSIFIENPIYVCAKALAFCPGLEDFEFVSAYLPGDVEAAMEMDGGGALNRKWTGLQKRMASALDKLPTTVRESIGRLPPATIAPPLPSKGSSSQGSSMATSKSTTNPWGDRQVVIYPLCDMSLHNNLRRFKLFEKSSFEYLPISLFAQCCPNLEEIDIHSSRPTFEPNTWSRLAAACPQLRSLRVHLKTNSDMGDQKHVLLLFPRLELLSASTEYHCQWTDWKATVIDDCLAKHSQDHPNGTATPLALRTLHLKGQIGTVIHLLEIMSNSSPLLVFDTLVVGCLREFRDYSIVVTFSDKVETYARTKYGFILNHLDMTDMRWNTVLKGSLKRLDISTMILLDQAVVRTIFGRFQELENLQALSVSALHLHFWMPEDFSFALPTFTTATSFPSDSIDTTTPVNDASSIICTPLHPGFVQLPKVEYHFPSIQDLIVEPMMTHKDSSLKWMTVDEAVYALAAMPGLECFCLRGKCMKDETLTVLRRVFPMQFMAIPEERLDWLV